MTHESALAVARVIQRCDEQHLEVLDVRHEVTWPDGSTVQLHPVRQRGADEQLLRAYCHRPPGSKEGSWTVFNLQHIAKDLAAELQCVPSRDQPGTLIYGLRRTFHNADAFRARVYRHELATWPGEDRAAGVRPTGTGRIPVEA